jgi:hypothetical protein
MTKRDQEVAGLTAVLAKYTPVSVFSSQEIARDAVEIVRLATTIQRIAVIACNRELSEREKRRDEACEENLRILLAKYKATVSTSGDPRGYVVKVRFPDGERHNDYGGEGLWCL